ncbi:MAG: hypothetical protein IJN10_08600 [Firmicutes bacterium]|nr:hypothetical protein [Bacillota bacterium]
MKRKKRWLLKQVLIGCLALGMFVGCGHDQEKGERNGRQKAMGECIRSKAADAATASSGSDFKAGAQIEETDAPDTDGQTEKEEEMSMCDEQGSTAISEGILQQEEEIWEQEESCLEQNITEKPAESSKLIGEADLEESQIKEAVLPYYLTEEDKTQVLAQLAALGEEYGLTYHSDITEGETWDAPTPIYEEELILGRDHIMSAMVEYTEGAFVLMKMEECQGFALSIKERPQTITDAYYEVYVYWI